MRGTLALTLIALCALAGMGCYSPSYKDCEVGCAAGSCPDGLECRAGMCRVGESTQSCGEVLGDAGIGRDTGDPDAVGDRDGDTITDDRDNCPDVRNLEQYNEDGDKYGDVCDPCPTFGVVGGLDLNQDDDGDMVGNGCDPHATVAGDRILFFDGLNVRATNAIVVGLPWSFQGGQATATTTGSQFSDLAWPVALDPARVHYILTSIHVAAFGPQLNNTNGVGVIDGMDTAGSGTSCMYGYTQNTTTQLILANTTMTNDLPTTSTPYTQPAQDAMPLLMTSGPASRICSVNTVQTPPDPTGTVGSSSNLGFHVRGASASYDFILVLDSPGP